VAETSKAVAVYLEIGKKRTIAGVLDWPGWCRGGRDEEAALQALIEYGPRYERVLKAAGIRFSAPEDASALEVVERVEGNATTDFGAPDVAPPGDAAPVDDDELRRLKKLLEACWEAFDVAVQGAEGKELSKGPRGGGREVEGIVEHVMGAEASYLSQLGGKAPKRGDGEVSERVTKEQRRVILKTLEASAHGEVPAQGPRGGSRWSPRYFVRRAAWHVLDHVWEIEDRVL